MPTFFNTASPNHSSETNAPSTSNLLGASPNNGETNEPPFFSLSQPRLRRWSASFIGGKGTLESLPAKPVDNLCLNAPLSSLHDTNPFSDVPPPPIDYEALLQPLIPSKL